MLNSIYLKSSGRRYYVTFFIAFLILSAILLAISPFIPFNVYQLVFALLVLNFAASGAAFLYFQNRYIHVEDEVLTVRQGVLTSKMSVIPFNKIDEIKTQYTLFDRVLGIGTIMIDTAGTSGVEVVFSNVPQESINAFLGLFRQYRQKQEAPKTEGGHGGTGDNW